MSRADHAFGPRVPQAGDVDGRVARYRAPEERNGGDVRDYEGVYRRVDDGGYHGRLVCLEVGGARISSVHQCGSLEMDGAWCDDTLAAAFAWGTDNAADGAPPRAPSLLVWGPRAPISIRQNGTSRNMRIGLRGEALAAAMADPKLDHAKRRWLRPELMRPRVSPSVEWHLQARILATAAFTERALARGPLPAPALRVAAEEVTGSLIATLAAADPDHVAPVSPPSRGRLVARALQRMEAALDEPVSISALCRDLGVGERTLQRAFGDVMGVGPRAYERQRRLRRVHGAILMEGDRRSLTDIAMAFGFWHLGRFAGAYAALYGCTPRETRRRAWGETSSG
jgi:AraC-like DNA-binding protein